MRGNALVRMRSFVVRGLAMAGVVAAFALGGLGTQVATTLGISSLALTTTTTPAQAQWGWRRGEFRRGEWRRGWGWRRGPHWRRGWDAD